MPALRILLFSLGQYTGENQIAQSSISQRCGIRSFGLAKYLDNVCNDAFSIPASTRSVPDRWSDPIEDLQACIHKDYDVVIHANGIQNMACAERSVHGLRARLPLDSDDRSVHDGRYKVRNLSCFRVLKTVHATDRIT